MKTKDKILKTALILFAEQGIHKTSTNAITKKMGMSSGALFVHFKTKQILIDTLYLDVRSRLKVFVENTFSTDHPPEMVIRIFADNVFQYFSYRPEEFVFLNLFDTNVPISPLSSKSMETEFLSVEKTLQRWQSQGFIRNLDLRMLYALLWSVLSSYIRAAHQGQLSTLEDRHFDLIWDLFRR